MDLRLADTDQLLADHPNQYEATMIAKPLFQNDWGNCLVNSNLERGGASLRFYRLIINSEWLVAYDRPEIEQYGSCIQMLDDALDWQKDKKNMDYNVFLDRERRSDYMGQLAEFLRSDFYQTLRHKSWIYRYLARACIRNLVRLVEQQ